MRDEYKFYQRVRYAEDVADGYYRLDSETPINYSEAFHAICQALRELAAGPAHAEDCPYLGAGACNCGVEKRPC